MISAGSKLIRVIGFFGIFSFIKPLAIGKLKKAGILRAKERRYLAAVFLCNPSPSRFTLYFPRIFVVKLKLSFVAPMNCVIVCIQYSSQ